MPISLRRRPRRSSPERPTPAPTLGALSLPDLTAPLVDTDDWPPPVPPVPASVDGLGITGAGNGTPTPSLSASLPKDAKLNGTRNGQQSSFGKPGFGSPWGMARRQRAGHARGLHGGSAPVPDARPGGHTRNAHGGSAPGGRGEARGAGGFWVGHRRDAHGGSAPPTGVGQHRSAHGGSGYSVGHSGDAHGGSGYSVGHSRDAHGGSGYSVGGSASAHGWGGYNALGQPSRSAHGGSHTRGAHGGSWGGHSTTGERGAHGEHARSPPPPVPPLPGAVPESVTGSAHSSQSTVDLTGLSGLPGMGGSSATLPFIPYTQSQPLRSPTAGQNAHPSTDSLNSKYRQQGKGRAPALVRDRNGASPDFHRPFSASVVSPPQIPTALPGTVSARKRAQKRVAALTIMVAGPTGSGKTSFIEALTSVLDPDRRRHAVRVGPTTSVVRHEVTGTSDRVRRHFVILDTPGLPSNDMVTTPIRGKALNALISILEERQARLLDEETKVVRRKSDGGELVHLVIYVIDARTVLTPLAKVDVDWDTVSEPPPCGPSPRPESELLEADPTGVDARLHLDDIEAIRRFSARANVLPILTHVDALTTGELFAVRLAVRRDLATVFGKDPLGAWGVLTAGQDFEPFDPGFEAPPKSTEKLPAVSEDGTSAEETREGADGEDEGVDDGSPDEDEDGEEGQRLELPYGVFSPEPGLGFNRKFRWGKANASKYEHSDLPHVRDGIIYATEWLRTSTREVVYERFRTERLLNAKGVKGVKI